MHFLTVTSSGTYNYHRALNASTVRYDGGRHFTVLYELRGVSTRRAMYVQRKMAARSCSHTGVLISP